MTTYPPVSACVKNLSFFLLLASLMLPLHSQAEENIVTEANPPKVVFNSAIEQKPLYQSGDGFKFYRIPALTITTKGALLAFCEGRVNPFDSGRIDIVVKKSDDGGATWSKFHRVAGDGTNTWGNPCAVVDQSNGRVWLFMCHNLGIDTNKTIDAGNSQGTRSIWACHSDDEGTTWTAPEDLTATTKNPEWRWCATGPGIGIQLKSGKLVIPCNFTDPVTHVSGNYLIYSDDHGKTWGRGGLVFPEMNESQVVQLGDGKLLLNSRPVGATIEPNGKKVQLHNRIFAWSSDEGKTWLGPKLHSTLSDPQCEGSTIVIPSTNHLLFSNPQGRGRQNLVLQTSTDDGKTWVKKIKLCDGPAAYSSLAMIDANTVGCLYEAGIANHSAEFVMFAKIPLHLLQ